jgi:hypothetical protein
MNRLLSLCLLGLAAPLMLAAARPAWAEAPVAPRAVTVVTIAAGTAQDLVVLDGGWAQGLQRGMVAVALEAGDPKARLLIAEATEERAVALILELSPDHVLQPGDTVRRSLIRL